MQVVREGETLDVVAGSVVSIGTFDGVHLGHRALLAETRRLAGELGSISVVAVVDRRPDGGLLTDLGQRIELLAATDVDVCWLLRPDEETAAVIAGRLRARALVVGEDSPWESDAALPGGPEGEGEVEGEVEVVAVERTALPGETEPVSTAAVRAALTGGDMARARALLGRSHELRGIVEHGDHRGRTIGFPTANLAIPGGLLLPADGVYSGWFERQDGQVHAAAINLGRRPTFYEEGHRLLEAYLLDFDDDLYGEAARVRFGERLHGEVKFASVDELVAQMHLDVDAVRQGGRPGR